MSNSFELQAEQRDDKGKGASRRLRRAGLVPGIIYGAHKDSIMITLPHNELSHNLENEAFYSHILGIKLGRKKEKVVLKDLQRHPSKPFIMHVDFQRIDEKEAIRLHVPLHFINEKDAPGVKQGGRVSHTLTDIEVSCLPKDLPEFIEVDMSAMEIGQTIHLSGLTIPKGVDIPALAQGAGQDAVVVTLHSGYVAEEEEGEDGEGGEEEAVVADE
ncbi:LSU ribosomal protein L25p [hydrothermal vent metagenome]|uniref:LSU ribosomal protein L25p n=1 Tax=hydrothermal vent metagenome TaxID=652676 RepID=A0A3B1AZ39_9ZZZZ